MGDQLNWKRVVEALRRNAERRRKHASFFDWGNKETKELAICTRLGDHLVSNKELKNFRVTVGDNPPDCVLLSGQQRIAIEITELVDREAIDAQMRNEPDVGREWTPARLARSYRGYLHPRTLAQDGLMQPSFLSTRTNQS